MATTKSVGGCFGGCRIPSPLVEVVASEERDRICG
jgi:hypothetical protein